MLDFGAYHVLEKWDGAEAPTKADVAVDDNKLLDISGTKHIWALTQAGTTGQTKVCGYSNHVVMACKDVESSKGAYLMDGTTTTALQQPTFTYNSTYECYVLDYASAEVTPEMVAESLMQYTDLTECLDAMCYVEGNPVPWDYIDISLEPYQEWDEIQPSYDWTGEEIEPVPGAIFIGEDEDHAISLIFDWLDFTYENNINPGTATITATGKYWYVESIDKNFEIVKEGPGPGPEPTPTRKARCKMNGGYIMVNADGLELTASEPQTVKDLYKILTDARKTGKPVYVYNCVYDEMPVSPIHVFLTKLDNGSIVGTASVLQVIVASDDTVTINSMIAG